MDYRSIQFSVQKQQVDLLQLQSLFNLATFWAKDRNLSDLQTAIAHSNPVVSAWNQQNLVGFARATSDETSCINIMCYNEGLTEIRFIGAVA